MNAVTQFDGGDYFTMTTFAYNAYGQQTEETQDANFSDIVLAEGTLKRQLPTVRLQKGEDKGDESNLTTY